MFFFSLGTEGINEDLVFRDLVGTFESGGMGSGNWEILVLTGLF